VDLTLSADQLLLAQSARRFLEERNPASVVRLAESHDDRFLASLWEDAGAQGWTGIGLPGEYGGADGTVTDLAILAEQLGWFAFASPLIDSYAVGALPLLWQGRDEQRERWLPRLASGACLATLAHAEPGRRDEWEPVALRGKATTAGGWRLEGTKILVPYASVADVMLVTADLEGVGLALVAIELPRTGVSWLLHDSISNGALFAVELEDVEISPADLLGDGSRSHETLERALDVATLLHTAYAVGLAARALDLSVQYARVRQQFGRPIGSFQAVAHRCVDMRLDVDALRVLVQHASWRIDVAGDAPTEVSTAKSYANGALRRVMANAHQVHGAIGYSEECDLQLYSRRAKALELTYGGTARHRERVAAGIGL
jgi:alkylation response protein AidB-like acyl-CoA dehydrogenase